MRIGLFGGSFNPPHICHTLITVWALETRPLEAVWWIPTFDHAFDKDLIDFDHRHRMCQLALRHVDGEVAVSEIERELGGESRTIDTVRALEARRPDAELSLIIGSDILAETDEWKEWERLVERVELTVVARAGYAGPSDDEVAGFWMPDVSSTDIRRSIRSGDGETTRDWVAASVREYIERHGLYRSEHERDQGG